MNNYAGDAADVLNYYTANFPKTVFGSNKKLLTQTVEFHIAILDCCDVYLSSQSVDPNYKSLITDFATTVRYSMVILGTNNELLIASRLRAILDVSMQIMYYYASHESLGEVRQTSFRNCKDFFSEDIVLKQIDASSIYSLYSKYSTILHGSDGFSKFRIDNLQGYCRDYPENLKELKKDLRTILIFIASGVPRLIDLRDINYSIPQKAAMKHALAMI